MPGRILSEDLVKKNKELKKEITRLRKSEKTLKESDARWRSLLENVPNLITIVNEKGVILYINRSLFGLPTTDMVGMSIFDFVHPDYHALLKKKIKYVFKKGERGSYQAISADTERLNHNMWFENHFGPVLYNGKVVAMTLVTFDITERVEAEEALKTLHNELEEEVSKRTKDLEETNTALRVLLKKREEDKSKIEESILLNVKELVIPYLLKIKKSSLNSSQKTYVDILETNLNDIISPFSSGLTSRYLGLTPSEIQVANLVRQGKSSKEMAGLLNMSSKTIDTHRYNIRKKIGLKNKKVNLRTFLLTFE